MIYNHSNSKLRLRIVLCSAYRHDWMKSIFCRVRNSGKSMNVSGVGPNLIFTADRPRFPILMLTLPPVLRFGLTGLVPSASAVR
jgi:hypothetical protein